MTTTLTSQESREELIFIGEILGPFFLQDPKTGNGGPAFEAMSNIDVAEAAADWPFVDDAAAAEYLDLMKSGLAEGIQSEALTWEYRRLFIGPNVKPAPPWGSVYTDREMVIFGETTLALRQWMRQQGTVLQLDEKTPEDHIGLMLLLLAWVAENKPESLEDYLCLHLLTWSSHFLEQLVAAAEQPFYQGLAGLTKATLEGVQQQFDLHIEYPRFFR
jgi:TorA maturation chaperone TorD